MDVSPGRYRCFARSSGFGVCGTGFCIMNGNNIEHQGGSNNRKNTVFCREIYGNERKKGGDNGMWWYLKVRTIKKSRIPGD